MNVYTVAQINNYIKKMFTQDCVLQSLCVKGEVSNCKYHSSGHIYFTLKDNSGTLSAIMFAGDRKGLGFTLKNGQQVVVLGNVDVFTRDGKYQLYAKSIRLDGLGDLFARYEQLKKELRDRGMFDQCYKQPIPKCPRVIGVVTAETGAAVRDIIQVSKRRNPYVQILLYPAIVQGPDAAPSVVRGISLMEKAGVDVMIVGRGGGSIEDLWAFNEEIVAQAIFDCSIPIISAVGHETDWTIADEVADVRAATPSAAAELATMDIRSLISELDSDKIRLNMSMDRKIREARLLLEKRDTKLTIYNPETRIRDARRRMLQAEEDLQRLMDSKIQILKQELAVRIARLKGLSPMDKLAAGYSYTATEAGVTLTGIKQVNIGDRISVFVKDGQISARVETLTPKE